MTSSSSTASTRARSPTSRSARRCRLRRPRGRCRARRAGGKLPDRFLLYPGDDFPAQEPPPPVRGAGHPARPPRSNPAAGLHRPALRAALARPRKRQLFISDYRIRSGCSARSPPTICVAVFRSASALVFPSLFEGIGMPLLEALQYGLPVISSNVTCLPEVAGDAALYLDPTRVEDIVEALLTSHQQPGLLSVADRPRQPPSPSFDWPRAARTYVACYRAAAGAPRSPRSSRPSTTRRPAHERSIPRPLPVARGLVPSLVIGLTWWGQAPALLTCGGVVTPRGSLRSGWPDSHRRDQRPGQPGPRRRRRVGVAGAAGPPRGAIP